MALSEPFDWDVPCTLLLLLLLLLLPASSRASCCCTHANSAACRSVVRMREGCEIVTLRDIMVRHVC